jgi:hypothetical protein
MRREGLNGKAGSERRRRRKKIPTRVEKKSASLTPGLKRSHNMREK